MGAPPAMSVTPELRARLRALRFDARLRADATGFGRHAGRSLGAGLEFERYRAYEPGDEPRRVDWKLYARSDRFFVRDSTRESPLTVWALLDTTASMAQADRARPDFAKLDAGKLLIACLGEIATRHGDAFGVIAVGGDAIHCLPAGAGPRHCERLLQAVARFTSAGEWPAVSRLRAVWERIRAEATVVMISDGFDPGVAQLAIRLANARRQVLSLGLVSVEERDFPFDGGFVFRDPETGRELRVDAGRAREEFLARFAAARAALVRELAASGIRHVDQHLDEAPDRALGRLLRT
jgi:uncharacterized protein (DUF58 family)